jgi:hypothetical protein
VPDYVGVAEDDPHNAGPSPFSYRIFRPKGHSGQRARIAAPVLTRASTEDIEGHVQKLMQKDRHRPIKPPPPLSQSLAEVDDPVYGLSAVIQTSRGGPALVHPENGRCVRSRRRRDRLRHTAAAANRTYSPYLVVLDSNAAPSRGEDCETPADRGN